MTVDSALMERNSDLVVVRGERDVLNSPAKRHWKIKVKDFARKLGIAYPQRRRVSDVFFPSLRCDPRSCKFVVLRFSATGKKTPAVVHINGVKAELKQPGQGGFLLDARLFRSYENIVAFPVRYSVSDVILAPVLLFSDMDGVDILLRKYVVEGPTGIDLRGSDDHVACGVIYDGVMPAVSFIRNARIEDESSSFAGLYYPAYDIDHETYRLSSWVWTNAAIVRAFLVQGKRENDRSLEADARNLVDVILRHQEKNGPHSGAFMARWECVGDNNAGFYPVLATNDSAFVGAYALLPAYERFGDRKYLDSAVMLGQWLTEKGMLRSGRVTIGFRPDIGKWVDQYVFVDVGFTAALLAGLYHYTEDRRWLESMRRFMAWYVDNLFDTKRDVFSRIWYRWRPSDRTIFTRGQAWALDGLICCYEATGEEEWLNIALRVARRLCEEQMDGGGWSYVLDRPDTGMCAKGIPIIAYHLLRIWKSTGDRNFRESAERALQWCDENTIADTRDGRTYGGIHARSEEGTICGAPGVDSIFSYASSYYMLAKNEIGG